MVAHPYRSWDSGGWDRRIVMGLKPVEPHNEFQTILDKMWGTVYKKLKNKNKKVTKMQVEELLSCQTSWAYGGGHKFFKILSFSQWIIFNHCTQNRQCFALKWQVPCTHFKVISAMYSSLITTRHWAQSIISLLWNLLVAFSGYLTLSPCFLFSSWPQFLTFVDYLHTFGGHALVCDPGSSVFLDLWILRWFLQFGGL